MFIPRKNCSEVKMRLGIRLTFFLMYMQHLAGSAR